MRMSIDAVGEFKLTKVVAQYKGALTPNNQRNKMLDIDILKII